jgi:hypothetical protein
MAYEVIYLYSMDLTFVLCLHLPIFEGCSDRLQNHVSSSLTLNCLHQPPLIFEHSHFQLKLQHICVLTLKASKVR